jgi:SAM-dependent methyltransferase
VKLTVLDPPRVFSTGRGSPIEIRDCARIALDADEQVTFVTEAGGEYDVARKHWGFYATPSLNGRLLNFGLRPALARSHVGKYYVFLVEHGQEAAFDAYLAAEQNRLVRWLDTDASLDAIAALDAGQAPAPSPLSCMCGGNRFTTVHTYFERPAGEVVFPLPPGKPYRREIFQCSLCQHFVSIQDMEGEGFYGGQYVDATYGDAARMRATFDKIIALPEGKSDNQGRVAYVDAFARRWLGDVASPTITDVGSGLCVFLHEMRKRGWDGTALDPDPRAAAHARQVVGVRAVAGVFGPALDLPPAHVISFNKVIEHVKRPIEMLAAAIPYLRKGGLAYVELPDGEEAAREGFGREEFFFEHHHVFSMASFATLADRAGFTLLELERLREPSTKYTLRGFLTPRASR